MDLSVCKTCAPPVELVEDVGFDGRGVHAAQESHCISCRSMFDYIVCMCPRRPLLVSESLDLLLGFATASFFAFCLGRFVCRPFCIRPKEGLMCVTCNVPARYICFWGDRRGSSWCCWVRWSRRVSVSCSAGRFGEIEATGVRAS